MTMTRMGMRIRMPGNWVMAVVALWVLGNQAGAGVGVVAAASGGKEARGGAGGVTVEEVCHSKTHWQPFLNQGKVPRTKGLSYCSR